VKWLASGLKEAVHFRTWSSNLSLFKTRGQEICLFFNTRGQAICLFLKHVVKKFVSFSKHVVKQLQQTVVVPKKQSTGLPEI
jgi:hypothetical protein